MNIELNTVVIVLGLIINAAAVINHFTRLERRFTKIETFLRYRMGFEDKDIRKSEGEID